MMAASHSETVLSFTSQYVQFMFNLAEERPFHLQINIAAAISVVILLFGRLIQPETGGFGSPSHLASVGLLCICWAVLVRTRRDMTFRIFGLLGIVVCAIAFRMLLSKLAPHGDYWRFLVFALILVHGAVLFSRIRDYVVVAMLSGAISFVGLGPDYFAAAGYPEFVIATAAASVIGVMLNIIVMSSYKRLYEAKEGYRLLSSTDPLTRLLNRRAFMARFAELRIEDRSRPLHLAMIDLDHFKQINDTHGHERGDAVLLAVADCLQRHVPGMAGRLGGEEFAILFSEGSRSEALQRLETLLTEVRRLDVDGVSLTFSAGLVTAGPEEEAALALARADAALYQAKAAGRNRIVSGDVAAISRDDNVRPFPRQRVPAE